jgi:HSP20 family protein
MAESRRPGVATHGPARVDPPAEGAGARVYPREFLEAFWGHGGRELPVLDVCEGEDGYVVSAELPGVSREDVTVEVLGHVLTIRGEKKRACEREAERCRVVERTFGAFSRSFTLPADANAERISATLEHGVLTVTVAKQCERAPRVIEVGSS